MQYINDKKELCIHIPKYFHMAKAVAQENQEAKQIIMGLRIFEEFEKIMFYLLKFGITGQNLCEYHQDNGESMLGMVNALNKRIRGLMARPVLLQDMKK